MNEDMLDSSKKKAINSLDSFDSEYTHRVRSIDVKG